MIARPEVGFWQIFIFYFWGFLYQLLGWIVWFIVAVFLVF